MRVAILEVELHIPESGSLKSKRQILQGLIRRLRNRFNLSATEVEFQNLWQRSRLGLAIVCTTETAARQASQHILNYIETEERLEVIDCHVDTY